MLIFPEGGRSPDGWGQPFRGGAAYLSLRCDVPVVPVHLEGTGRILRKGRSAARSRRPRRSPSAGRCGPTRARTPAASRPASKAAVAALADEAATDWWQARKRAHAGTTPALQGPEHGAWRRTWALGDRGPKRRRRPRLARPRLSRSPVGHAGRRVLALAPDQS